MNIKNCIACGGIVLSLSMTICNKCLASLPPDLPDIDRSTTTSISTYTISDSGVSSSAMISSSTTTTQSPNLG